MAERAEEPIKYDSLPNFPAEGFAGTDLGPTRVPRDWPVRTTPRPRQTLFQRHEALLIGSFGVAVFFVAWQAVASARIWSPLFLARPVGVRQACLELVHDGERATRILV